jgi:hypothetical protein
MQAESFCLALVLWERYERILNQNRSTVCQATLKSLTVSPFMLEFKLFFLAKVGCDMSYQETEQILNKIE